MNIYNLGSTMYICEYLHFRLPDVHMSQGCFRNLRKHRESGGYIVNQKLGHNLVPKDFSMTYFGKAHCYLSVGSP